jgi:hypothetical protein
MKIEGTFKKMRASKTGTVWKNRRGTVKDGRKMNHKTSTIH